MVIRTITCHHAFNHGAMLQALALVTYLKSLGHDIEVIDYRPHYMPPVEVDFNWVPKRYDFFLVRQLYRCLKYDYNHYQQQRRLELESFFKRFMPVTSCQYSSIDDLKTNPPKADLYIAGSDQIWNTTFNNGIDASFYLDFGKPKRKISYAASFATRELKSGTEDFVKCMLRNFDAISVREESGLKLLKSMGYDGEVVVDPAFLISYNQWDELLNLDHVDDDYILAYDFEKKHSPIGRLAKRLSSLFHCRVYSVSPFKRDYADKSFVCCAPDKFVSLIKNARCVVSNSFHGTAFSMIYGRNFFVVNRKDGLNMRMHDLLSHYGLEHRLIRDDVPDDLLLDEISYQPVYRILNQDIGISKAYLQRQISLAI